MPAKANIYSDWLAHRLNKKHVYEGTLYGTQTENKLTKTLRKDMVWVLKSWSDAEHVSKNLKLKKCTIKDGSTAIQPMKM